MRFFYVWCFLLAGFFSMLSPSRCYAAPPTITAGQLDLATYNYKRDVPVSLAGDWLFYWKGYVDSTTLLRQPRYQKQPGSWRSYTGDSFWWPATPGHATYGLRIKLPAAGQTWSVRVPAVRRAYRLFANEQLIAQVGTPGTDAASTYAAGGSRRAMFYVPGKEVFLRMEVASYHDNQSGPVAPLEFGTIQGVEARTLNSFLITASIIGGLVIIGLYHLGLFFLRRKDLTPLYLGLLCLCAAIREHFTADALFYVCYPGVSWHTAIRILYLSYTAGSILLMLYLRALFGGVIPAWLPRLVLGVSGPYALAVLFLPHALYSQPMFILGLINITYLIFYMIAIWRAWREGYEGAGLTLFATGLMALFAVNDNLVAYSLLPSVALISIGIFLLACCQSVVLAQRFATAYYRSQRLAEELQLANQAKVQLDQQRQAAEKKKVLEEAKSRFLSNLTHEFRTPLTLIISPVDYWTAMHNDGEDIDPSILQLMFTTIRRNAHQLLRLINQLLDLSKLEAGSMQVVESRGDIRAFVGELVESFQLAAESRSIVLKYQAEPCPPLLLFDADKIEKILYNLLSNALKFTPSGGYVAVKLSAQPRDPQSTLLKMSVEDSGVGMSPDQVAHVFERFFQTNDTPVSLAGGSGIGLALVKELVETMDGTINLSSEPGVGTTFTVEIPARQPDTVPRPEAHISSTVPVDEPPVLSDALIDSIGPLMERDRPVVLVVEDNADLQQFIANILGKQYLVRTAANGPEGWAMIYRDLPDVVISDVMMPGLDGFELSRLIRETPRTSHIPVLILTARTTVENRLEGLKAGANDYLAKPFHHQELQLRVASLLSQRKTANPEDFDFDLNDLENNIFPAIRGRGANPDAERST